MRSEDATHSAQIIAANSLLDRGWGRPPQVEVYDGRSVNAEEHEGSALEYIESRLAEMVARMKNDPEKLN
jgi:hypothetical protein